MKRSMKEHLRRISGIGVKMLKVALRIPSPSKGIVDAFNGKDTIHSRAWNEATYEYRNRKRTHPTFEEFVSFTQASLAHKHRLLTRTSSPVQRAQLLAKIGRISATLDACYAKMDVERVELV